MEDLLRSSDSDSSSSRNQSPKSHTGSFWTTDDSNLPEDFFTEGFLPHFNTSLKNLSDLVISPTVPVL